MIIDQVGRIKLSRREIEICQLVAENEPYKVIAAHLKLSTHTVCARIYRLFAALRVTGKGGLALWVIGHPEALKGNFVDGSFKTSRQLLAQIGPRQKAA